MMSEQPQLRLVSRGRYAILLSTWLICFTLALVSSILGIGLLILESYYVALGLAVSLHIPIQVEMPLEMPWQDPWVLLIFLMGGALAFAGRKIFVRTQSVVPFAPITPENTHLLPAAESLVRASMPGPQSRQAELLRAAPSGQSTPQDHLLRAGQSPSSKKAAL